MKTAVILAIAIVVLSSIPMFAQQAQAGMQTSMSASAGQTSASQSTAVNVRTMPTEMRPVHGELVGKLDAKSAKAGDKVVVKTTETFKTAEGTTIPKGSKLIGHVSKVQAHGSGNANSQLGIIFDRAELKDGGSMAIHATIECVAPSANELVAAQMDRREEMSAMNNSMVGGRPMGPVPMGGGGLIGEGGRATAGIGSELHSTTGGALGATSNFAGRADADIRGGMNTSTDAAGGLGSHVSKLPGVTLKSNPSSTTSGVLVASKRNVHLDSGTRMTLGVAGATTR